MIHNGSNHINLKVDQMQSFNEIVMEFNSYVQQQRFVEAIEKFYHPEVISCENNEKPVVGIDRLRSEAELFLKNTKIRKIEVVSLLIENGLSVTNWYYSFENNKNGDVDRHQFSLQRWSGNKIVQEQHVFVP